MVPLLPPPHKDIVYDPETRDYAMFLDDDFKGYAPSYHVAEVIVDLLILTNTHYANHTAILWTLYTVDRDAFYGYLATLDVAQLAQQADLMASYLDAEDIGTGDGATVLFIWHTRLIERANAAADAQREGDAHDYAA